VALGVEKKHNNVMDRPPRPVNESLPNLIDILLIFYLGAVMVTGTLLVYYLAGGSDVDVNVKAMTMCFSVFIVYQLFNVMNCRSGRDSVFKLGIFSNRAIYLAIFFSMSLLLFVVQCADVTLPLTNFAIGELLSTTPLELKDWGVIIAVASTVFFIEEFRKLLVTSGIFSVNVGRR